MKHLNFLTKSGSQSGSHRVVTLASTVGSPSAHRRGTMLKHYAFMLLFLLGSLNVWGYTITFSTGSGDGTSASTSTACSTIVSDGASYLSGNLVTATKVYYSGSYGLKLGASSNAGTIKMNLASSVTPTSIVVSAKLYNSSKAATLKVNGSATQNITTDFSNLTFNITSSTSYIQLESSKYCWIESITVNTGSSNPTLSLSPTSWDFESVATNGSASKTFKLSGSNLTAGALTISVPNGYSVSPSSKNVSAGTLAETDFVVSKNTTTAGTYNGNFTVYGGGVAQANAASASLSMTVVAPAHSYTYNLDFTQISGFSSWGNSYSSNHTVDYDLYNGHTGNDCHVYFAGATKQGSTITNMPVAKDAPVNLILDDPNKYISAVKFVGAQWGSKAQTMVLKYSTDGGTNWTAFEPAKESTNFAIEELNLPAKVNAVQVSGSNSSNQIGYASVHFDLVDKVTYNINKSETGCTLSFKKGNATVTSAEEGDEITVTATASTGFENPSFTVKDADNNPVTVTNGKFTMPAKAVTVTGTASKKSYTVTLSATNGNIQVGGVNQTSTSVQHGGNASLTAVANSGYAFQSWATSNSTNVALSSTSTNPTTITVTGAATVTANFRKLVQSITVKNGETNVSGQIIEMTVGDVINLSVDFTPSDAYDKSLTWNTGDNTKATLSNGTLTAVAATTSNVTMTVSTPDLNDPVTFYVKVNAPVGNVVALSQPVLGGTVDASPKGEVDEDTEVTLSYSALSTHEFVEWIVKDEDDNDVTVTNNKFTMPDKSVTVTASFRPKAPVFTPVAGEYEGNQVVKLTSYDNSKFLYYYTLNGDDPDDNSTPYDDNTNGITLTESATLKMIVFDEELQQSAITTAVYTITHTPSVLTLSANGNTYTFDQDNTHYLNDVVQLPTDIPNNYKIAGKVFKGWSSVAITTPSAAQPTSDFYQPGDDYTLSTAASTLYAVYATEVAGATTWNEIALGNLGTSDIFVIVGNNGSNYAMTNDNGTGSAPAASAVTIANNKITSTVADNLKWKISGNATDGYTFYPNGSTTTWLYCTNTNNGVHVGTNTNKVFTIDGGYLKHSGTNRYVGIYDSQDWRCYTSKTGNSNIANQTFKYYKRGVGPSTYNAYTTSVASYDVTAAVCENGSVSANVAKATENATITITATPNTGYDLLSFDVYKTGESSTKVDFTVDPDNYKQATFSMPAYAVTVSATFIKVGTAENPLTAAELIASQANLDGYYVYAQGIVSQLGSFNSTNGYYTYYFSADGTTTSQFEVYNGYKGSHQEGDEWYYDGFSAASDLALGDEVIVEGYIKYFNNTKYQFEAQNSELTSYCRPVVVTKGAESNGTFTITAHAETITDSKKYCLADLSGENDLTVTVEASPASGYRLKSITSKDANNQTVGTIGTINANVCTITGIKASTTITANFEQVFAVALAVDATGTHQSCSATINGGAGPVNVAAGETINLVASLTDSENDEFVNFTATTGITITPTGDLTATATATQAGTITANFRPLADPHTITNGGVDAAYGTIVMKDTENKVAASLSLRPDKTGKLVATETDGYRFTGWTVTPANAVTFADATAMETTFAATDVAATISASYEARTLYTVKFMNGNTQIGTDATVHDGRTIDLMGAQTSFDANHTRFCGWVKNSFEGIADAEPSFVSGAQTIDGNTTFYAVYGNANETNNYGKITEAAELESGKNYLIVAEYNSGLEALHAAILNREYWLKTGVVTADDDVIASNIAERKWQISVNAGVAHVYNAENEKYLGVNYVSSGDHYNARIFDDAYDLTITPNDGAWNISGVSNTKTVYVIHAPDYQEYIGSNVAAPVYLYKQLYESDEWVSLPVEYVNVTFDKNAGSETVTNMPANITNQMKGYSLTAPSETPARGGYNFIGWNTDNEATEPMSFPQTINTNTTVYAIWQAYPDCAIDLYVNGVKDDDISTSVKQGAELDLSAIDAPERLGYDFLGWAANPRPEENTTAIDIVDAYTPTPNVDTQKSFYAVYTRTEGETAWSKTSLSGITSDDIFVMANENEDTYHAINNGGTSNPAATSISVADNKIDETVDANLKWTLSGNATDGYTFHPASDETKYLYCNTTATSSSNTNLRIGTQTSNIRNLFEWSGTTLKTKDTYTARYVCIYTSGPDWRGYTSNFTSTNLVFFKYVAPTTYYTTNPAAKYSVSYDLGDGAWRTGEGCDEEIVAKDGSYDICTDVPVLADYIFTNWTIGEEAVTEATITITGTTVIVANYRAAETYTLNYDANGAVGSAPAATNVKEGAEYTVLANAWFFKSGYTFTGWNTAADGSGAAYAKDEVLVMPSENTTLYAQWVSAASDRNVVIVNQYGDKYYAMGQTLGSSKQMNAVEVNLVQNKVEGVAAENRADITWRMITNNDNTVSFYNANNSKYLGYSGNDLAYSDDAVNWTWDGEKKCYKIGNDGTRTFLYRNSDATSTYNYFKYFGTSNIGNSGYASRLIIADGFMNTITSTADDDDVALGDDVFVKEGATLTLNDSKPLGDVVVEKGGTIDAVHTVSAQNLYIQADATGSSAQVVNAANIALAAGGNVFFDLKLGAAGKRASQWHAFTVPFEVDAMNGIFDKNDNKLTNEVNYAIMDYHGDIRANGQYGWKKYRGILQPGVFYIMTVDSEREVYRFKKANNDAFAAPATEITINAYGVTGTEDTNSDHGWNGVGNPNLVYGKVNATVQVLDPESYQYEDKDPNEVNFTVGTPFFYQAKDADPDPLTISDGDNGIAYAPARVVSNEVKTRIYMSNENYSSRLTVTANEDALNQYQLGEDLVKMTMTNTPRVPSITAQAYDMKLCRIYTPLVNNNAEVALNLYAPANGEYTIAAPNMENADLYLTKDGAIIWNLTMSAYPISLNKGTTEGYGLLLKAKAPQTPTGVEQSEVNHQPSDIQKIIIDDNVFILRGGQMYDVTGKAVK